MVKKQQLRYDFSEQAVTTKTHYRVGPVARGSDEFDLQCSVQEQTGKGSVQALAPRVCSWSQQIWSPTLLSDRNEITVAMEEKPILSRTTYSSGTFPEQTLPKPGNSEDQQWDEQMKIMLTLAIGLTGNTNPVPCLMLIIFQYHTFNTIPRNLELLRASQVFLQDSALYLIFYTVFHPHGRCTNYPYRYS